MGSGGSAMEGWRSQLFLINFIMSPLFEQHAGTQKREEWEQTEDKKRANLANRS